MDIMRIAAVRAIMLVVLAMLAGCGEKEGPKDEGPDRCDRGGCIDDRSGGDSDCRPDRQEGDSRCFECIPDSDILTVDLCPDGEYVPCLPDCDGKECGDDGCGGVCGTCPGADDVCEEGKCNPPCEPDCDGKECGDDGCGGVCGTCPEAAKICEEGKCKAPCEPDCDGKQCGDDGCGGECGECGPGTVCEENTCLECNVDCEGKECGDDGCGGYCGICTGPLVCQLGKCVEVGTEADCKDLLYCMSSCDMNEECKQQCYLDCGPAGQAAYDAVKDCTLAECEDLSVLPSTLQLCIVDICGDSWSTCLGGWGPLSCQGMLSCLNNCSAAPCEWNCLTLGSQTGQSFFWALQSCIQLNCSDCGEDQECYKTCAQTNCLSLAIDCQFN